jgi:hypothetical protein
MIQLSTVVLMLMTLMVFCVDANGYVWTQRGDDIDGEAMNDQSGTSVAMSGDGTTLAVGAPGNAGTDTAAGHVRVFRYDSSAWLQLGDDIDGEKRGDTSV